VKQARARVRYALRVASGAGVVACAAWLFACGSGDDTATPVPLGDAGAPDGTTATSADACVPPDGAKAGTCTCVSPAVDPYSACSPFARGCIPFDASRVPSHPML
jgi:hypothetical protein